MTGQTIKGYTFRHIIGKGGMATVYLASDNKFQTNVAVKVLNKEFIHNENIRHRFLAEARNMFRMSHPNVIKVTDLIDEGDFVAFVMDYIEGHTLKDYLETKSSLSDHDIKRLFSQMLAAVGYVHEQGMVHRDIKPSNFIISMKDDIKLLDFGIAKNTELTAAEYTLTSTTQNMGTPMYMSPEQIKSSKEVEARSDIYSIGVVLWQMVTGKKPFDVQTLSTFDIQLKIVNEPLLLTGTGWDAIIQKATQKKISERYPDISSFQQAVKFLDIESDKTQFFQPDVDRTIIDKSPGHSHPIIAKPHVARTNNKMKYYAVAITILLAVVIFYFLTNGKKDPPPPPPPPPAPQVVTFGTYPFTSERRLNFEDIRNLSSYDLKIMRNEIYARHGLIFEKADMINHFSTQKWYSPRYRNVNDSLSDIEIKNIEFIRQYENSSN